MHHVLAVLLLMSWLSGCENLHNRLHSQVLNCGEDVRALPGVWIKVLDPQGKTLPEHEQLDARVLRVDDEGDLSPALPVSKKHCVRASANDSLVIRSLAQDKSWSVLLKSVNGAWDPWVRLQDSSQQRVRLRCPVPWIHNGRFLLPLEFNPDTRLDAFALAPGLIGPEGREWSQKFALQGSAVPLVWPQDWPDGLGRLVLHQRNYLQNAASALAEVEESCAVTVDRQKPVLQVTPKPSNAAGLEVQPGSLLRLQIADLHPANLEWCLEPNGSPFCQNDEVWQRADAEVSLPMPAQGRWRLRARAYDAAGNASEPLDEIIEVLQRDLLHTIAARVDQALAEKSQDSWQAGLSLMRALVDYQRLVLPKEQQQVKSKLIDGILATAPAIQERLRVALSGSGRKVWSLNASADSPWLVLTNRELSLWSASGMLLSQVQVPDALTADWSATEQTLILGTLDQLLVFRIQDSKFLLPQSLRWVDHSIYGAPSDARWIPGSNRLLVALRGDLPALIQSTASGLRILERLDFKDAARLAVSFDGQFLAATNSDELVLWRSTASGWNLVDVDELPVNDLQFIRSADQSSRLLIQLRDGRLISWSPDVLWKEIDKGIPGELPTERPDGRPLAHIQSWSDGSSGLMERGGRFYQWSSIPNKTLQSIPLNGFAWDRLRQWKVDPCEKAVWMQDDRSLSYWEWQEGPAPTFVKLGEWSMGKEQAFDFQSHCNPDDRDFVSLDTGGAGRLRFWSQRGPLPMVRGDKTTSVVSSFLALRPEGSTLVTAGFDGRIRSWDQEGKKLQEWIGHTAQVNEVRWMPDWQLITSSAEDGSSRLWNLDGSVQSVMSLKDVPNALWRDGVVAMDQETLLSAGTGVLALWQRLLPNSTKLTITIPMSTGERSGFDSMIRLPGEPRILTRLLKSGRWRGLIIDANGQTQNSETGLPPLQNLKWLEWSQDGQRLALADAQQVVRIFRQEAFGWQEEAVGLQGLNRLVFAPDGRSFAAVGPGQKLRLGSLEQGQWQIQAETLLASPAEMETGLRWSADGSRVIYAQNGVIFVRDQQLQIQHQVQAFPETGRLSSFGLSQNPDVLAAGAGPWVRIIDFNLQQLQTRLCTWFDAYLKAAEAPSEIVMLCSQGERRKETRSTTERIPWR